MDQTNIPLLEGINLPLFALRAALTCASDEATRHLNGIYVHAIGDEYRIVASDGHRLFVYSVPIESERRGASVPAWLTAGVIIPRAGLGARLNLLAALKCETAYIAYQVDAPQIVISDLGGEGCSFKMQPVDGTFCEYQRVLDGMKSFEARDLAEMSSTAYDAGYLKDASALAKLLGAKAVRVFGAASDEPSLITFPECPFAMLVLTPQRHGEALGAGVAKVLSVAVNGTISALKAHRTRWADKLDYAKTNGNPVADIEAKIAEYEIRIAKVIANTGLPALPAPSKAPTKRATEAATGGATETPADQAEASHAAPYAISDAVQAESNVVPFPITLSVPPYIVGSGGDHASQIQREAVMLSAAMKFGPKSAVALKAAVAKAASKAVRKPGKAAKTKKAA